MTIVTSDDIYNQTTRMDIHQVAKELTDALGPTLVAVLAGIRDRKLPTKWSRNDGPTPRDEAQSRLRTAHRAWRQLVSAESEHVARAWFIGLNPLLGEKPPTVALADGLEREVLMAAQAFCEEDRTT